MNPLYLEQLLRSPFLRHPFPQSDDYFLTSWCHCLFGVLPLAVRISKARVYFPSCLCILQETDIVLSSVCCCHHPRFQQLEFQPGNQQVVVGCPVRSPLLSHIFRWPFQSLSYANVIFLVLCHIIRWHLCGIVYHFVCENAAPTTMLFSASLRSRSPLQHQWFPITYSYPLLSIPIFALKYLVRMVTFLSMHFHRHCRLLMHSTGWRHLDFLFEGCCDDWLSLRVPSYQCPLCHSW